MPYRYMLCAITGNSSVKKKRYAHYERNAYVRSKSTQS